MRVILAQINPTFADFKNNSLQIKNAIDRAKQKKASLVITSELALVGYPPNDFLFSKSLMAQHEKALDEIVKLTTGITLILGALSQNPSSGKPLFNSALHIENGKILGRYHKQLLPTYDVFDERRYFEPGSSPYFFDHLGQKMALSICEDIWFDSMPANYLTDPLSSLKKSALDFLINLSASPFEKDKASKRFELTKHVSKKLNCSLIYCNQVGANDDLIFDGLSHIIQRGEVSHCAQPFETSALFCNLEAREMKSFSLKTIEQVKQALVLGIRDYFEKLGFQKCAIGLSGGIDSAVVAALASEALGPKSVQGLLMPSSFSSEGSLKDAKELAKRLNIQTEVISIEPIFSTILHALKPLFKNAPFDLTEENIQARIRGLLLMATSNKFNQLVLCCSNKSELAVGYSTLYGDLIGALAPIGDLTKTEVYALAKAFNQKTELIPEAILTKGPSAELRENQLDTDSLPPYDYLDALLLAHIEKKASISEIADQLSQPTKEIEQLIQNHHRAEYKRRQAPLVLKISQLAFSSGWKYPVVHRFAP